MGKVVRFYKPSKDGKKLHRELVIHKAEVFKAMTENWKRQYGEGNVEMLAV